MTREFQVMSFYFSTSYSQMTIVSLFPITSVIYNVTTGLEYFLLNGFQNCEIM